MKILHHIVQHTSFLLLSLSFFSYGLVAQNRQLLWADEFNGTTIDKSTWQFESGPTNDNVHFYTDRADNAKIVDGKLQIIALKESHQGFDYTSAHIKTEQAQHWKYGRIEASIKLPGTPGFVPAFWMLPADNRYGWWPHSGEIDIMEHPTNEIKHIYGTVHTEKYNLFSGSSLPQGGVVDIPDAETAFHLYAVEWTPEKIDFYVDDQIYYSFENDEGATDTWPFNQPFYIILNLAVGGGWVGTPDETTTFPAVMEVDYVRVYQDVIEASVQGTDFVTYQSEGIEYRLDDFEGATYQWGVPGGAQIVSGQGTPQITVNWGIFGGNVSADITTGDGTYLKALPVKVAPNYLKNSGFEKGVKFWHNAVSYPSKASFSLTTETVHQGDYSINVEVTEPDANAWDVQLSQRKFGLQGGTTYHAGFWAKAEDNQGPIAAAVINSGDFSLEAIESFYPSENWTYIEFDFTASSSMDAAFNIDLGGQTGNYYFDDFVLTTHELTALNQLINPDFFEGDAAWNLNTLSSAEAQGAVEDGVYTVSISNGGANIWDIHLGQNGLMIENGFEYLVSFDAYAEFPRQISAMVGKNGEPWTVYSEDQLISLTTERQTYTYSFAMTEPTDLQSRLGFDIGGNGNNVYFDNVLLRKVEATNTSSDHTTSPGKSAHLLQNYPNPFHLETSFHYVLNEPANMTLKLFNISGQEVGTIVSGFQQKGDHQISWRADGLAAGIYFYRLEAGESLETRKLILLH